ncbi:Golgi-associated kinase 1B [Erpetoichthys calabaricus]|uniref:Golgi associated kinase 1B n=1 Tax=Erpetoichthys calabaricus TaxID=27687 RepID=A0A8C4RWH8_ERPCA|nr:Golgi-associated kinase 1B [Erpetoichthys calabaricus]
MDAYFPHLGRAVNAFLCHSCAWLFRAWSARRVRSKRNLLIASACFIYLFFIFTRAEDVLPWNKPAERLNLKKTPGAQWSNVAVHPELDRNPPEEMYLEHNSSSIQPNVVYITLKSKRSKPANIRGTVRPKFRKKRTLKNVQRGAQMPGNPDFMAQDPGTQKQFTKGGRDVPTRIKKVATHPGGQREAQESNIRIYSESPPPWLSREDLSALRFLADCNIAQVRHLPFTQRSHLRLFDSEPSDQSSTERSDRAACRGRCGLIKSPMDMSEVFAFHLDRILGLNRTLPAVSRRFSFLQGGHPCPAILWDSSLLPADNEEQSTVRLTWKTYQNSLKQKCWHRGIVPKAEWGCADVHHYEWSKLTLFDFLLQIYNRLDRNCCGFKPRKEDSCVENLRYLNCSSQDDIKLVHIIQRSLDPRHLVFIDNKGYFDRDEDNLDFKLLEGIKEFPESAVSVLKGQTLRQKLLQSLFLDKVYWESQGGRQGIERLIDVIERRAKILLTYINAHGIKVIPMNE